MFDIQNYGSFIAAILVFQAIPGAGTIAILDATARDGRAAGMASVLGTLAGDFLFMVAAVAGLAAVMQANPMLFQGLQWFGAAYLGWMGLQLILKRADGGLAAQSDSQTSWSYFRRAFAVCLTNPKVILFFVAFFPLFLKPNASAFSLPAMMLHVTVLSLVYQTGLVLIGNFVAMRLRSYLHARLIATRLAGFILIGLSAKLVTSIR
ncbi:MAG: LysE family translocator [Comamonadaceae bacterium]|nr:LysE family translocator [Comamonadaceae bacterium]